MIGGSMFTQTDLFQPLRLSSAASVAESPTLPPVSPRTADWWRKSLKVLSEWLGDDRPVEDLTRLDMEQWHESLLRRMSPVTANNYLRAARIVFNRLEKTGYLAGNPAALVPPAPQPPNRPQAVKRETYCAMYAVADVRARAVLALLWGTGARIGELPTITLKGLELWEEEGRPRLAAFVVGKHHRRLSIDHAGRYLYASDEEAAAVGQWLAVRPYCRHNALFTDRTGDKPIPISTLHAILRKLRLAADLPPGVVCNAHAFRHGFAYRKRREGYPLEWISEWLGHSDPAFTAKMYGDKSEPEIRRRYFEPPPRR